MSKMPWPHRLRKCLEWRGLTDSDGYGRVKHQNTDSRAHRVFYELYYGVKLTPEVVLLHSCDNPKCFNPHHLTPGTQAENVADMDAKGRRVSGNSLKDACPEGHPYNKANTVIYKDGKRRCRKCMAMKRTKRKTRND